MPGFRSAVKSDFSPSCLRRPFLSSLLCLYFLVFIEISGNRVPVPLHCPRRLEVRTIDVLSDPPLRRPANPRPSARQGAAPGVEIARRELDEKAREKRPERDPWAKRDEILPDCAQPAAGLACTGSFAKIQDRLLKHRGFLLINKCFKAICLTRSSRGAPRRRSEWAYRALQTAAQARTFGLEILVLHETRTSRQGRGARRE